MLAETDAGLVMRAETNGPEARPVVVIAHEDLTAAAIAAELRLLADQLASASLGIRT